MKAMKGKMIGGIVGVVVGVLLIIVAAYIKAQIASARETVQKGTGLFSSNPIGKSVGGFMKDAAESKIQQYECIAKWSLYGGIILVLAGGAVVIFCRKK